MPAYWGSIGQGFMQGQDDALQRQAMQLRLRQMQEQQRQEQQQQQRQDQTRADMGAFYRAGAQQMPPAPTPPMPGQGSMPPQQPPQQPQQPQQQGLQLPPALQIPGMTGGQQQQPKPPQLGAPGGMAPPKPYTEPQQPQQQQQQQPSIGPVPQQQAGGMPSAPMTPQQYFQAIKKQNPQMPDDRIVDLLASPQAMASFTLDQKAMVFQAQHEVAKERADAARAQAEAAQARARVAELEAQRRRQEGGTEALPPGAPPAAPGTRMSERAAKEGLEKAKTDKIKSGGTGTGGGMKLGKPQIFKSDTGEMYSQMLTGDGKIITRDKNGRIVDDEVRHAGSAGQETMRNTVKLDISEVDYALDEIAKATSKTSSPFFMDNKDKGAFTRWRDNKLAPDEMQQYDVYANRIASAIAGIQSMGRGQISDEKIRQAQKLVPQPGDGEPAIKAKLAAIKRIRDNAEGIMQGKSPEQVRGGPGGASNENLFKQADAILGGN